MRVQNTNFINVSTKASKKDSSGYQRTFMQYYQESADLVDLSTKTLKNNKMAGTPKLGQLLNQD